MKPLMTLKKKSSYAYFLLLISILTGCIPKPAPEKDSVSPPVRVLLQTLTSKESISFTGSYYLLSEEARYEFGEQNKSLIVEPIPDGIHIYNNNRNLLYRNHFPIILEPVDPGSHFIIQGKEYAGEIHFIAATNNEI